VQVFRQAGGFPHDRPSAARFGMWTKRRIVRSATGRTPGGEYSAARAATNPNQGQSGPAAGACNGYSTSASRSNDGPAPALVAGGWTVYVAGSVPNCAAITMPDARRPHARSLLLTRGRLPPTAQAARLPRATSPRRCAGGSAHCGPQARKGISQLWIRPAPRIWKSTARWSRAYSSALVFSYRDRSLSSVGMVTAN
jgi:hypothetical protein